VDRDPEERREGTRRPSDSEASEGSPSAAADEGREGNRRGQQVPFPHHQERPQDGLERSWWRRIFRGPHEEDTERPWWRRMFGGG
jgi:hypothetical protein